MRDAHVQTLAPRIACRGPRWPFSRTFPARRTASQVLTTDIGLEDHQHQRPRSKIFNRFNQVFLVNHGCFVADGLAGCISIFAGATSMDYFFPRYAGCFPKLLCADAWRLASQVAPFLTLPACSHILFDRDASRWLHVWDE